MHLLTELLLILAHIKAVASQWSYNTSSEDRFVCGTHNNSYPTDCETSGTAGGPLKCYTTTLNDGKLTISKS
jgi:hypothetical protein